MPPQSATPIELFSATHCATRRRIKVRPMTWFKRARGKKAREKATALVTQGVVHARQGHLDKARLVYEEAVDVDEGFAVAHLNLGLCRLDLFNRDGRGLDETGQRTALDAIVEPLRRAVVLDPSASTGWRALARVEERRGRFGHAEDAWQELNALAPKDSQALLDAQRGRQAVAGRAAADRARRRALAALDVDVDDAERAAALAQLLPLLDNAEINGVLVRGFALAGTLARRTGNRAQARVLLEKAVAADARDVEALRELASVALEEGDLARALDASVDAYREDPADAGLVCNVGVCHLALGDVKKAGEYIELAWRLEPKDPIVARAKDALGRAQHRE
jgi:tetratricopeptide (TPR) repeat protein